MDKQLDLETLEVERLDVAVTRLNGGLETLSIERAKACPANLGL